MTGILCRYKKLVNRFLETFSSTLKPREISIWKEKLTRTCDDVQAVPRKGKETKPQRVKNVKENQPTQKCDCCPIMSNYVVRLDSVSVKIYAFLNLVQVDQTQAEANFCNPDFHRAPAKEIDGDEIITITEVDKMIQMMLLPQLSTCSTVKRPVTDAMPSPGMSNSEEVPWLFTSSQKSWGVSHFESEMISI